MPAEWISSLLVERLVSANRKFSCAVPSNTTAPIIEKGQQEALPCNCGPFVVAVEAASGGFRQVWTLLPTGKCQEKRSNASVAYTRNVSASALRRLASPLSILSSRWVQDPIASLRLGDSTLPGNVLSVSSRFPEFYS